MAASGCLRTDLRFISDETLRWHRPADDPNVAYGFCVRCGGSLFWKVIEGPDAQTKRVAICAGSLDQPTGLTTELSVFTADAADYHNLDPTVEPLRYESPEGVAPPEAAASSG